MHQWSKRLDADGKVTVSTPANHVKTLHALREKFHQGAGLGDRSRNRARCASGNEKARPLAGCLRVSIGCSRGTIKRRAEPHPRRTTTAGPAPSGEIAVPWRMPVRHTTRAPSRGRGSRRSRFVAPSLLAPSSFPEPSLVDQCAAADVYRGCGHGAGLVGGHEGRHVAHVFQGRGAA